MRTFKQLILMYRSGEDDFRHSYKLGIDQRGHTFWEAAGAVDTKSKVWRLFEGDLNGFDLRAADLKGRPSDTDERVLDARCMCLTIVFRDETIFTGIHYFLKDPPGWMAFAEVIVEAAEVAELVRPLWKRLADSAQILSCGDRERLIRRLGEHLAGYESIPAFLRRNGE